tara:strand:- start:69 stop:2051 length:1983 start_codon:yes stop_codon:yes gene_type:complete
MANWTVNTATTNHASGDSISATGGSAITKVLTITPNTGFVISASNFKIGGGSTSGGNVWTGGNVDSGVSSVTFADTGTAGAIGNTVTATVVYSNFTMPSSNKVLRIDIDEIDSTTAIDRYLCVRSQHVAQTNEDSVNKHTVTTTSESGITQTDNSSGITNGIYEYLHSGTVTEGPSFPGHLIFTKVFAANTTYGYYYDSIPTFVFNNSSYAPYFEIISSSETYDSDNNLTGVTFKCYYTPPVGIIGLDPDPASTASGMCELGQQINFNHNIRQIKNGAPGESKEITSVQTLDTNLSVDGETRTIRVVGDVGAEYNLNVAITDNGHTYDFTSNTFTAGSTTSSDTTIPSVGYNDFSIVYPSTSSNDTYDITISALPNTTTASNVPTSANDLRLFQYINVVITLGLDDTSSKYNDAAFPTAITLTGVAGQDLDKPLTKDFSYTVTAASLNAGDSAIDPHSSPLFELTSDTSIVVKTDGSPSSAQFDIDSTSGLTAGDSINWTVEKFPLFDSESTAEITVADDIATDGGGTPSSNNLTVGMVATASNIRSNVTILSVEDGVVSLSDSIQTDTNTPILFTASGITISSVDDANTITASQSLSLLTDDFSLTFGGTTAESNIYITSGVVTDAHPNVTLTGTLNVTSFGVANSNPKLDIEKLITRS